MGFSKEKVNRSGRLLADEMRLAAEGKSIEAHERGALEEAVEVVEWWRGQHARPLLIEIQLRTPHQDRWANSVELLTRTIAPGLKFGEGPPALRAYFAALGEFYAARDSGQPVEPASLARLSDLAAQALISMGESNEP
jgi:hypothetical protein